MISKIGDSVDELTDLRSLLEIGLLNRNENIDLNVTYKLFSGDILLIDRYNHIVDRKEQIE